MTGVRILQGVTVAAAVPPGAAGSALGKALAHAFGARVFAGAPPPVSPPPADVVVLDGECEAAACAACRAALEGVWAHSTLILRDGANAGPALRARADYVLSAALGPGDMGAVVQAVIEHRRTLAAHRREAAATASAIERLSTGAFEFRSLDEAKDLAALLALTCPEPKTAALGLQELLINAVEHGNLGLSADDKARLLISGGWREEIERRRRRAPYCHRLARLRFRRRADGVEFHIEDDGDGFDASAFAGAAPAPPTSLSGRGIWLARTMAFDEVEFLGDGNEVRCLVRTAAH